MDPGRVCPQCGSPTIQDLCPNCATAGRAPAVDRTRPVGALKSKTLRNTAYLLLLFLAIASFGKACLRWGREFTYERQLARIAAFHHDGPAASAHELTGSGRIYLVHLGTDNQSYSLENFAQRLRSTYGLDVQVLSPTALDSSALGPFRSWVGGLFHTQYVAELLYGQIKRDHPELAKDRSAYLIGFTNADMYPARRNWNWSFTERDGERAAIISTYAMQDDSWVQKKVGAEAANQHFQARIRRILLKDIALLYWHLPLNDDQTSLLHDTLDPDLPTESIYRTDLNPANPARTRRGQHEGEPCVFLSYSSAGGIKPVAGCLIRTCSDDDIPQLDESNEIFEVDLRLGVPIDRHTDFNLADTLPIEFQRATRDGWSGRNAFGISGTHNYDEFLYSLDNVRISVIHSDGGRDELMRDPRWLPILQWVKYVDMDYSGRYYEMRWRSGPFEHYDLKRFDGALKTFLPCSGTIQHCYLTGYRDAQGQELEFERGSGRKLVGLTSPNKSWIHLTYGPDDRVAKIDDSRGRTVRYAYDELGRLIGVTYPSGEVYSYEYDSTQHMLTFSVAQDTKAVPTLLLRNEYANGRLVKQTLAGGLTYTYRYSPDNADPISAASVSTPEGRLFVIDITDSTSTVHERDTFNP
jgi:YD repeat-containing protein